MTDDWSMYLRNLICLFASFTLIACSASSVENEPRVWTDAQGRTMEAELVEVDLEKNEVVFLKDTGRRYRFRIDQLSKADQKYIHEKKDTLPESVEPAAAKERTNFEKAISKDLVQFSGGRIKRSIKLTSPPKNNKQFKNKPIALITAAN